MTEDHDRLASYDIPAHNAEVKAMWEAYNARKPYRVPVILGVNSRYFMRVPEANPKRVDFRTFTEDPDTMFETQLGFQRWARHNLLQDAELGVPEKWQIHVDFQNYYEAAWFGCPVEYFADQVPDTSPVFADRPERVMENGLPDPFGGLMAKGLRYYERFKARAANETYLGLPVEPSPPWFGMGSDGPLTVACNLFGPTFVCTAMAAEPERLHVLLDFITEATIERMRAFRLKFDVPVPQDGFGIADDSIALISTSMYRDHVLPYHKLIYSTFGTDEPGGIHLCGNSTRHFVTIRDELNVTSFDTGFPVDFAKLRSDLGPDVQILGGPHVELLRSATPGEVYAECRRILESGVLAGGRFILREGNNLAPLTPLENTEAMYRAGRDSGQMSVPP